MSETNHTDRLARRMGAEFVARDVAESWRARADNLKADRYNLLNDIAVMMSKHVDNWPEPKQVKTALALISKTLDARADLFTTLQARGDRLAGALERSREGWANAVEFGLIPERHMDTAVTLEEDAREALTEWIQPHDSR